MYSKGIGPEVGKTKTWILYDRFYYLKKKWIFKKVKISCVLHKIRKTIFGSWYLKPLSRRHMLVHKVNLPSLDSKYVTLEKTSSN